MGNALPIPTQTRTIKGSQVRVGMFIRNTRSAKKQLLMVTGGSEFSKFGLPRLLTNLPASNQGAAAPSQNRNFHQTLAAFTPENGSNVSEPGYFYPIDLDQDYEVVGTFDSFEQA